MDLIEEFIEVKKYDIEFYVDIVHRYGLVKCDDFFVGDPYNIIIRVVTSGDSDNKNNLTVFPSDKPLNVYDIDFTSGKVTKDVYSVMVPKKWVNDCYELYKLTTKSDELRQTLFRSVPDVKTSRDLYN